MKFKSTTDAANEMICLMRNLCETESTLAEIERIADLLTNCFEREGKVLICGMVEAALMPNTLRKSLPADSERTGKRCRSSL